MCLPWCFPDKLQQVKEVLQEQMDTLKKRNHFLQQQMDAADAKFKTATGKLEQENAVQTKKRLQETQKQVEQKLQAVLQEFEKLAKMEKQKPQPMEFSMLWILLFVFLGIVLYGAMKLQI